MCTTQYLKIVHMVMKYYPRSSVSMTIFAVKHSRRTEFIPTVMNSWPKIYHFMTIRYVLYALCNKFAYLVMNSLPEVSHFMTIRTAFHAQVRKNIPLVMISWPESTNFMTKKNVISWPEYQSMTTLKKKLKKSGSEVDLRVISWPTSQFHDQNRKLSPFVQFCYAGHEIVRSGHEMTPVVMENFMTIRVISWPEKGRLSGCVSTWSVLEKLMFEWARVSFGVFSKSNVTHQFWKQ